VQGLGFVRGMPPKGGMAILPLVLAISVILPRWVSSEDEVVIGRRLKQTSTQCSTSLEFMLKDTNWLQVNNSMIRWCRLKLENEMARCCSLANFEDGISEGCSGCEAKCQHYGMQNLCQQHFGQACTVRRKPFNKTGSPDVEVMETFCVPADCNNQADKEVLIARFGSQYAGKRYGWHEDYDSATLECDDGIIAAMLTTLAVIVGLGCMLPVAWFLFKAPKESGKTLISQAEMQDLSKQDEDADGTLRSTGMGMDALGNSGFGAHTKTKQ